MVSFPQPVCECNKILIRLYKMLESQHVYTQTCPRPQAPPENFPQFFEEGLGLL